MLIDVISDLHTEMSPYTFENSDSDVLILSGDTIVVQTCENPRIIFDEVSSIYPNVIFIMGNHEYYHGSINYVKEEITHLLSTYENIHLLENRSVDIDGITFVGGTMWTNMNNFSDESIMEAWKWMNDFRLITGEDGRNISPYYYINEFNNFINYLSTKIKKEKNYVVCTHYAPSKKSTPDRYIGAVALNGAYSSNLDNFIIDNPQIKLWTHGHTHDAFDYTIGQTRIVCNPRGYVKGKSDYKKKTVEI